MIFIRLLKSIVFIVSFLMLIPSVLIAFPAIAVFEYLKWLITGIDFDDDRIWDPVEFWIDLPHDLFEKYEK